MLHPAANRHRKATHQCLLSPYGRPSLPFATSWGSKPAVCHAASCSQQAPQGHTTHQCLLLGVQACRLPALKRLKTLQTLKTLKNPYNPSWGVQACRLPGLKHKGTLACFILQPTGTPRPHINVSYGRPTLPFASP